MPKYAFLSLFTSYKRNMYRDGQRTYETLVLSSKELRNVLKSQSQKIMR